MKLRLAALVSMFVAALAVAAGPQAAKGVAL
jgi:hypothetical protein